MFGSDCRGCFSVPTYEAALAHWERTPQPRSKYWEPHQRPLDNNRKPHYRLEIGNNAEYFDAVLWRTVMMRVYRPTPEGRRVQYTYHDSMTSKNFLWQVCAAGRVLNLRTTEGQDVKVPVSGRELATDLWFTDTTQKTIDVARSHHRPIARSVRSLELLKWRRDMLTNLAPLFQILEFQAEEIRQGWEPTTTGVYNHPGSLGGLSGASRELWALDAMCKQAGPALQDLGAWGAKGIDILRAAYRTVVERSLDVRDYRALELPSTDVLARQATRTLLDYMEAAYRGLRTRNVPIPDFPEDIPQKFVFA